MTPFGPREPLCLPDSTDGKAGARMNQSLNRSILVKRCPDGERSGLHCWTGRVLPFILGVMWEWGIVRFFPKKTNRLF